MTASLSPDCREGKHRACTGDAWDHDRDQPADCPCDCHDEAAAAHLAALRARSALRHAPELIEYLRSLLEPPDGRTERGIEVIDQATPLLTGTADDADQLYAILLEWVDYWRETLHGVAPTEHVAAWRNYQDAHQSEGFRDAPILGLPAHTTPASARSLADVLTAWLLERADTIAAHDAGRAYHDDVATRIFDLRATYGMLLPRPPREASPRPCPVCGELEVTADYFGGSLAAAELRGDIGFDHLERSERQRRAALTLPGIEVRCGHCGWVADARPSQIARWVS